jgi:hypothetical protein
MTMTIEMIVRVMLERAIEDGLVSPNPKWPDPNPKSRTSGELEGVANLLAKALERGTESTRETWVAPN